jgi:putative nucleotidyltransferase with HDIG domain
VLDGEKEMIPSIENCFSLMGTYGMLKNIRAHSVMVAKVASVIVRGLKGAGLDISVKKAIAGALLHDIGKTSSLNSGEDHAEIGRQICLQNNFEEIADIVGEHIRLANYSLNGRYSEKEIVFYADKRVNHDKIVSLKERLDYLIERYGGNQEGLEDAIRMNFDLCKAVEKKLFTRLDFGPESLASLAASEDIESTFTDNWRMYGQ